LLAAGYSALSCEVRYTARAEADKKEEVQPCGIPRLNLVVPWWDTLALKFRGYIVPTGGLVSGGQQ